MIFFYSENIFGYKELKIQLYFSAGSLNPYLAKTSSAEVDGKKYDGVKVSSHGNSSEVGLVS